MVDEEVTALQRILLAEDEPALARYLQMELQHENYHCTVVHDGAEALQLARGSAFDFVLLDVMLPQLDGLEVCRRLRAFSDVPVIMVTARDAVPDKIAGLDSGADDYIVKPFAIEELLARLRALTRRADRKMAPVAADARLRAGDLVLDPAGREVTINDDLVPLTKREFDLLHYLMLNANQVCTRDQILAAVWGYDFEAETNVVDVYVRYLRNKLGRHAKLLKTVRGLGYMVKDTSR